MGDVSNPDIKYGSAEFTANQNATQSPPVPETGSGRNQPPDYQPVTVTKEVPPAGKPVGFMAEMVANNTTTVLNRDTTPSIAKPMAKNTK